MEANYVIRNDESVLFKGKARVYIPKKIARSVDIMLTNKAIVISYLVGVLSNQVKTTVYSLEKIKIQSNKPNIIVTEDGKLEIYFNNDVLILSFDTKNMSNNVKESLEMIILDRDVAPEKLKVNQKLTNADYVADVVGNAYDAFKNRFSRSTSKYDEGSKIAASKCKYCGASISGTKGTLATCSYCDGKQEII